MFSILIWYEKLKMHRAQAEFPLSSHPVVRYTRADDLPLLELQGHSLMAGQARFSLFLKTLQILA